MNAETVRRFMKRKEKSLERYWDSYCVYVVFLANDTMTQVVAPFLRARGWKMLAGSRDWFVLDENGKSVDLYERDELCKSIYEALMTEVQGMHLETLGTIMDVPVDVLYQR